MTREAGASSQSREQFSSWEKGGRRPPLQNTRQAYDDEPNIEWREKPEPVHKAENNLAVKKIGGRRPPSKNTRQTYDDDKSQSKFTKQKTI
jgi:hypothetical protein